MGNHNSQHQFEFNSVPTTAKLILENGELKEFGNSVKVSEILNRLNSNYFICRADDMDYDDYISAINEEEELQIGQLYFALPLTWLDKPLRAPAMASLAVKASLALKAKTLKDIYPSGGRRGGKDSSGRGLEVKRRAKNTKFSRNLSIIKEK